MFMKMVEMYRNIKSILAGVVVCLFGATGCSATTPEPEQSDNIELVCTTVGGTLYAKPSYWPANTKQIEYLWDGYSIYKDNTGKRIPLCMNVRGISGQHLLECIITLPYKTVSTSSIIQFSTIQVEIAEPTTIETTVHINPNR